jgi:hypothetical protein
VSLGRQTRSISEQVSQSSPSRRYDSNRKRSDQKQTRPQQGHEPRLGLDSNELAHVCEPWKGSRTQIWREDTSSSPFKRAHDARQQGARQSQNSSCLPSRRNVDHARVKASTRCLVFERAFLKVDRASRSEEGASGQANLSRMRKERHGRACQIFGITLRTSSELTSQNFCIRNESADNKIPFHHGPDRRQDDRLSHSLP